MSIDLTKGERFNLTKGSGGDTNFYMGLSWDAPTQGNQSWDCDSAVFLCGLDANEDAKVIDTNHIVYFGRLKDSYGAVVHSGDNLTGDGDGDDEQIRFYLDKLPANIVELPTIITLYDAVRKGQNFGQVKKVKVRICKMDAAGNPTEELCKFNLSEDYSPFTAMLPGQIYKRDDGDWAFNAVGQGFENADLNTVLAIYT